MPARGDALKYAVRPRVILKYLGQLCLLLAAMTLVPLCFAAGCADAFVALRYLAVIAVLAGLGAGLSRLDAPANIQKNEGMALVCLMFLFTSTVMAFPMMGSGMPFEDAFFEAVSGVTTTGLSTRASVENAPPAFLFGRAWMQWYGGLGIVVFSLALFVNPGLEAKGLAATESDGDDLLGGTRFLARHFVAVYGVLTAVGIVGALLLGMGLFESVTYLFAAISTGGFAPRDASLAGLGVPVQSWILLFCLIGGLPLTLYHRLFWKKQHRSVDWVQMQALFVLIILGTLLLVVVSWNATGSVSLAAWGRAASVVVSAQSTAGFASSSTADLSNAAKLVLIPLMVVGGGVTSTAGGFKVFRLLVMLSVFRLMVVKTCMPRRAVLHARLGKDRLDADQAQEAMLLIVLYVAVVLGSWFPFVFAGYAPLDSLFDVVSATATVGLSAGVVDASLPTGLKAVLCADMLLGRLEIFAWIILFYPRTWLGRRRTDA